MLVRSSQTLRRSLSTVVGREAKLFTPGPLTTSAAVKQAMLVDLGSRDDKMISVIQVLPGWG
jgi:aspartate aminotransferase-like enzyme